MFRDQSFDIDVRLHGVVGHLIHRPEERPQHHLRTVGRDGHADLAPEEGAELLGIITCLPARARWTSRTPLLRKGHGEWSAEVLVEADGSTAAVQLEADAWIVGAARTGSTSELHARHRAAKLWQLPRPIILPLEDEQPGFPITALSFTQTGRRATPWSAEVDQGAEPDWSISGAVRLYVNTDLEIGAAILDERADADVLALIESDIHLAVLHRLASWGDIMTAERMVSEAEKSSDSLAALGANIAARLGLPLGEAMRLARESPLELVARFRESLRFHRGENP